MVYRDDVLGNKAIVKRFNDINWEDVGNSGFSTGEVEYTSIAINSSGNPYVVYRNSTGDGKATVKKFDGYFWETVGASGFFRWSCL